MNVNKYAAECKQLGCVWQAFGTFDNTLASLEDHESETGHKVLMFDWKFATTPATESVDHPTHYNSHPSGVECIDVVEHMTFNIGNAIKYLWRAGLKGDVGEDLSKAIWYIEREKQRLNGGDVT